nr:MAG: hypothetical protein DIU57_03660 [Pseudomonadota bacterium]
MGWRGSDDRCLRKIRHGFTRTCTDYLFRDRTDQRQIFHLQGARARAWAAIRRNNRAHHCGHWCFRHPKERAWIAELDGRIVGSVFLVKKTDEFAKLRLLYVEPDARGRGIGRRSVKECIAHARAVGYGRMELWADDVLTRARKINQSVGFKLVRAESHRSFGKDLVGETWELGL